MKPTPNFSGEVIVTSFDAHAVASKERNDDATEGFLWRCGGDQLFTFRVLG